jgi:hypothetical protein
MTQIMYKNRPWLANKLLSTCLAIILICFVPLARGADLAASAPLHLTLARQLLENVAPSHNEYRHTEQISLPSDGVSKGFAMYADCSGLAIALLDRASSPARSLMSVQTPRQRPLAEDFVHSIQGAQGFNKITTIERIQPGDLIAWKFTLDIDKKIAKDTGHVMLIDTVPVKIENRAPFVPNTTQYELFVIDSSRSYHDPHDTRVQADGSRIKGLGRGKLRLYVSADNEIVGFANNFTNAMFQPLDPAWAHYSTGKSKIGAIGRPLYH